MSALHRQQEIAQKRALEVEASAREVFEEERAIDPIDVSTQTTAKMLYGAIADAARRSNKLPPKDFDGKNCSCGEEIPLGRLQAGCFNCIDCQEAEELDRKRRGLPVWAS